MDDPIDVADWTVHRVWHDFRRIVVHIHKPSERTPQLAILRRIIPSLTTKSPASLLMRLRETGEIDLGSMPGREARFLEAKLQKNQINYAIIDTSTKTLFPVSKSRGGLIIEDEAENEAFCRRLIDAGCEVSYVES